MQVIPAIDLRGGHCVRLRQGDFDQETVFGDDPAAMAARWESEGAARIHLVDLDGAKTGRPVNVEAVKRIVETRQGSLSARRRDCATRRRSPPGWTRAWSASSSARRPCAIPDWFGRMAETYPGRLILGLDARDGRVATAGWLDVSSVRHSTLARQFRRAADGRHHLHRHRARRHARRSQPGRRSPPWPPSCGPGDRLGRCRRPCKTWSGWRRFRSRGASSAAPCMTADSRWPTPSGGARQSRRPRQGIFIDALVACRGSRLVLETGAGRIHQSGSQSIVPIQGESTP